MTIHKTVRNHPVSKKTREIFSCYFREVFGLLSFLLSYVLNFLKEFHMKDNKNIFLKMKEGIKNIFKWLFDLNDWKLLLRSIPGLVTTLFVVSVVVMNLMASKVIVSTKLLGITGGLLISWIPFLAMDIVVKTYGSKATTKLNILALVINLLCIGLFELVTVIQVGGESDAYLAFDQTFSQTWQIFIASSIAFLVSGIVNNISNAAIGKLFRLNPDGKAAYMARTYASTMLGQFVDNFVFTGLAFLVFFKLSIGSTLGYTILSVIGTSILGALLELVMEVFFSPIGYKICQKWRKENVGKDYLEYVNRSQK